MFDSEVTPIRFVVRDLALADPHPPVIGLPVMDNSDSALEVDELWAEGLLWLEGKQLYLEYLLRGEIDAQPLRTEVSTVKIPLEALSALDLRTSWRRTELLLEARSLKLFTEIPGAGHGRLVLSLSNEARLMQRRW